MKTAQQLIRYFLNGVVHEREARFISGFLKRNKKIFEGRFDNLEQNIPVWSRRNQSFWDESWNSILQKRNNYEKDLRNRVIAGIVYISTLLLVGCLLLRQEACVG